MDGRHSLHLGKRCPPFREKELGSALLDVPSTNCLLCLMLILHPSAEDCDDPGHVQGKLMMLSQPAEDCDDPGHVDGKLLMLFQPAEDCDDFQ